MTWSAYSKTRPGVPRCSSSRCRNAIPTRTVRGIRCDVQQSVLGAAHVAVITGPATFRLSDLLGKDFSVFRQAVRLYKPGFKRWRDDPYRHPLVLPERIAAWPDGGPKAFERWLAAQALAVTAHSADRDDALPSFTTVRQAAAQLERRAAKVAGSSDVELLALAESENQRLETELREQQETYEGLLVAAEQERENALDHEREARAQVFALRERIRALEARAAELGNDDDTPIPASLEDFEPWCQAHLAGQVEVHSRAVQGTKKSVFSDPTLLYRALLLLRDRYVPMKRQGGKALMDAFEQACRDLDIENSMVGEAVKRYKDEYTIQHRGQPRTLDWHLKQGSRQDRASCFRLYYLWDDEADCVVVGSMPAHLRSDLS